MASLGKLVGLVGASVVLNLLAYSKVMESAVVKGLLTARNPLHFSALSVAALFTGVHNFCGPLILLSLERYSGLLGLLLVCFNGLGFGWGMFLLSSS
ncbi:hypothetical protein V6N13_025642 [Hibiscus sabdariffa]|uniref:Uncharacterized protein n=1 Tax=Hibiscus sabdariffa TaxID=183260 RepID=A0ABR2CAC9_9ROSI